MNKLKFGALELRMAKISDFLKSFQSNPLNLLRYNARLVLFIGFATLYNYLKLVEKKKIKMIQTIWETGEDAAGPLKASWNRYTKCWLTMVDTLEIISSVGAQLQILWQMVLFADQVVPFKGL